MNSILCLYYYLLLTIPELDLKKCISALIVKINNINIRKILFSKKERKYNIQKKLKKII